MKREVTQRIGDLNGPLNRGTAAVAAASAVGLGIAHFVVARRRVPPSLGRAKFAGRVIGPAVAVVFPAAAAAHLAAYPKRASGVRRAGLLVGALTMSGLATASGVLSARRRTPGLFTPAGPGLWSLAGAPSFLVLARRDTRPPRRPPAERGNRDHAQHRGGAVTQTPLPPGQHAAPARRFGLPRNARWRPEPDRLPLVKAGLVQVGGEVRYPIDVAWDELESAVPRRQQRSDLHCVATWSTRDLHWGGLPFAEVLDILIRRAQPTAAARWLTLTGLDGYRSCLAIEDAREDGVLLADQLNGRPLPVAHGAPIRLVVPAQYGYKNVKHLARIDFHTSYRAGTAAWGEDPRARAHLEERSRGLPGWLYRWIYRALLPLAMRPYKPRQDAGFRPAISNEK